jgi:hypothetical protein
MKLVIIFWPQAVWKMTVWHALEKVTKLKLFHNHMTIDLVSPLLWFWSKYPAWKNLVEEFRIRIFEEFAKTSNEWLVFTFCWAFNLQDESIYIEKISNIFKSEWWETYLVELKADVDERVKRNKTLHRLKHKPSKRNIERSENELKESMNKYRFNSHPWEIKNKNYIKIDNTNLTPDEVANMIVERFWL